MDTVEVGCLDVVPSAADVLARIARAAGDAITSVTRKDLRETRKADASPVTEADRAAHTVILRELAAWTPTVPVISEEGTIPPYETRRSWRQFWLVDPLDGTKEFLTGSGEYTVNIAMIEAGTPVLGVVYAPALDLLYVAGRELGAWRHEAGGEPARLSSTPARAGAPLVVAESRSHPSAELEAYLQTIPVARRVRAGSSLKFCWLADGQADIYPRFGRTMEWDTAAGDCVFRYSGRDCVRPSPLGYNSPTLAHERFIIGGEA